MKNIEIERKFLVRDDFRPWASSSVYIAQGYLCTDADRTVRVRIKGNEGFLTIKGRSTDGGVSRFEWEREIDVDDAHELLRLCVGTVIEKERFFVPAGDLCFEVDLFHGAHEGLILAEIELPSVDAPFSRPDWLGEEVTGDCRYYNACLASDQSVREAE